MLPMCPRSTSAIASTTSCSGSEIDEATRIIARDPRTTATSASTNTGVSMGAFDGMIQPFARNITSTTIPAPGSAEHIAHIIISRARTPGALSACSTSTVAATINLRRGRCVNRKPVHTVEVAPNRIDETSSIATRPPPSMFNGIITTAAMAHGVNKIADWRLVIFGVFCDCDLTVATPASHTITVPTMMIATVAIRFLPLKTDCASMTVSSLTEMTIATTSTAERR